MTLNAEVGSASANSYADLEYADAYFENRLGSSDWVEGTYDESSKESALIQATRILDSVYDWCGWKTSRSQALSWPRSGCPDPDQVTGAFMDYDLSAPFEVYIDSDTVPVRVKDATCETAMSLLENSGYTGDVNDLEQIRVGPITLRYSKTTPDFSIPNAAVEMLRTFGTFSGSSSGNVVQTARVVRS